MSEKKRKRDSQDQSERLHKKAATSKSRPQGTVKVSVLQDVNEWPPLHASTPGLSLPSKVSFKPYNKPKPHLHRSSSNSKELLLHSSVHPKLDYVAREVDTEGQDLLQHYLGVYDPSNETLQLVPSRRLIVRGTLKRSIAPPSPKSTDDEADLPNSQAASRNKLGKEFGTKKSQKAIRGLTENAISPSKSRKGGALDPIADAVVDSMAAFTADIRTQEAMQAEVTSNKPIPTPNLDAESPMEVYTLDNLVGLPTLRSMQVKEWIDKVDSGEEVTTKSRFISARIVPLVKADKVRKLRALKYLLLLLEWFAALQKDQFGLKIPRKEDWDRIFPGWEKERITEVGRRFTERGGFELNKWHRRLLLTHILAIALVIDDCSIDVHDIRDDLHIEKKEIKDLYSELGAPPSRPTEADLKKLKLSATDASNSGHLIARLKLPLKFPKLKSVGTRGKRS